ncbi:MAG: SPFH domain-containing protein, partial [bacterium]
MEITLTVAIIILIVVIVILFYFVVTLYRKVPPNKALIVTGMGGKKVVVGGGTVVVPLLQTAQELSLEARIIDIKSPQILTLDKVPLAIEVVATVKINTTSTQDVLSAAERFLG